MNNVFKKKHCPRSEKVHAEVVLLDFPLSRTLETTLEQTIISNSDGSARAREGGKGGTKRHNSSPHTDKHTPSLGSLRQGEGAGLAARRSGSCTKDPGRNVAPAPDPPSAAANALAG